MSLSGNESTAKSSKESNSPLSVIIPGSELVISETRKIVGDTEKRQDAAAEIAQKDPVIVMELLKTANALAFTEGKPPITTPRGAIIRLGATTTIEVLDKIKGFPKLANPDLSKLLEEVRNTCVKIAETAKLISGIKAQNLVEDCYTAGLLCNVGELIAVIHLTENFLKIVQENSNRSKVLYRLEKDHSFDIEKMSSSYLKRAGIPEGILFAIDKDMQTKTPNRAIMKLIIASSIELVMAFESIRWDKIAPDKNLPPKSSLRMLSLSDSQYESLYERAGEILFKLDPAKAELYKK
ncbi:MAG: HDOD domain-containing protein [Bdellovibrionales bacterium]|nr:HDOD domain-containing protein [Bdellovibrionales bacterium]